MMKKRPGPPAMTPGPRGHLTPQNRSEINLLPPDTLKTKRNLNLTALSEGVRAATTKTCSGRNEKIELDLAYSKYLQNLLKQHLIDMKTEENKKVLSDQIDENRKEEREMRAMLGDMKQSVERAEELWDIEQTLREAEKVIEEFHKIHDEYEGKSSLEKFLSMLNRCCRYISVVVQQPGIKSERDCEKVVDMFRACSLCIEKALNCNSDYVQVSDLGLCIEEFLAVKQQIIDKLVFLNDHYDKLLFKKIEDISDLFAKQYDHKDDVRLN